MKLREEARTTAQDETGDTTGENWSLLQVYLNKLQLSINDLIIT